MTGPDAHNDDAPDAEDDEYYDELMDLRYVDVGPDRASGRVEVGPQHLGPHGLVHVGVHAGVVESLASVGATLWALEQLEGKVVVGVSNSTDLLRPHREGALEAVAEPIHRGRSQQLWEVVITRTSDGEAVARGRVRLQNVALEQVTQ